MGFAVILAIWKRACVSCRNGIQKAAYEFILLLSLFVISDCDIWSLKIEYLISGFDISSLHV